MATIKISDAKGKPLELTDLDAGGIKLTIAKVQNDKNGENDYYNYILTRVVGEAYVYRGATKNPALGETLQPGLDPNGTVTRVRPGVFTYKFEKALPPDYDRRATHVLGGEVARGKGRHVDNPLFEFVPEGTKVRRRHAVIESASCNSCHDPLQYHDGTRREAGYCALCHTSQLKDPESGESLDFKVFVHKIHRGKLLPSVKAGKPYFLVGSEQQVVDYSNLRYPQVVTREGVTKDLRNWRACHTAALNGDNWKNVSPHRAVYCLPRQCGPENRQKPPAWCAGRRNLRQKEPASAAINPTARSSVPRSPELIHFQAGLHNFQGLSSKSSRSTVLSLVKTQRSLSA